MNQLQQISSADKVMSSLELVDLINQIRRQEEMDAGESSRHFIELRHDNFTAKIAKHPSIDALKFKGVYKGQNNQERPCYFLPKREANLMVMSESLRVQAAVYDHMEEMESRAPVVNLSDAATLRALLIGYTEKVMELEAKVIADAPKVDFAEKVRALNGVCKIGDIGKTLGIGRTKLFKRLKEDKILMGNRLPYQKYIDKGYFTVIEKAPYTDSKGDTHPTFTAMVTGAGQVFIARRYADMMGGV